MFIWTAKDLELTYYTNMTECVYIYRAKRQFQSYITYLSTKNSRDCTITSTTLIEYWKLSIAPMVSPLICFRGFKIWLLGGTSPQICTSLIYFGWKIYFKIHPTLIRSFGAHVPSLTIYPHCMIWLERECTNRCKQHVAVTANCNLLFMVTQKT